MKNTLSLFLLLLVFIFPQNIQAQQLDHILGDLLVQFPSGISPDQVTKELSYFNGKPTQLKVERKLKTDMNIWLLHFDQNQINEIHFLNHLRNHQLIDFVQFNHILTERQSVPDDPLFTQQWQWLNDGSSGGTEDADVDADLAWDITTGGTTVQGDTIVVCVLEGTDRNHDDLQGNLWYNFNEVPDDGIDNDDNGYIDDFDGWNFELDNDNIPPQDHGTFVSGMIGAVGNNAFGVTGINWNVKIMHVELGNLTDANVVEAYQYPLLMRQMYNESGGTEGAFVIATNASWGLNFGQPDDHPLWCNMYDILGAEGILNCGATANLDINVDEVGDMPTACPSDFMVSVTATNDNDLRTFSAYGLTTIDLGAPGEDVYSLSSGGDYRFWSGTSFSSPLTAGIIALLYSAPCSNIGAQALVDPQGAALLVRDYLYSGVDQTPQLILETVTGGRANAFNSLQLILGNCGACPTPGSLSATNPTDTSTTLSWFQSDSVLVSDLRYRMVGDTTWTEINDAPNPFDLSGLSGCNDYEFQVEGICSDTTTGFSNSYFFSTEGCCIIPQNINIAPVSMNEIIISWDSIFGALGYIVNYKAENDPDWTSLQSNSTSTSINSLSSCTVYEFALETVCSPDSTSGFSDTLSYTTDCPCGIPENIDTIDVMTENATIIWSASLNANTYVIRYRKFGLIDWNISETTDLFLTIDSLDPCSNYQYQVQTICPIASSNFSGSKVFKTACPVGVDEIEGVSDLVIYPNPVINELLVEFDLANQKDISIQIFNTAGQLISSTNFENTIQGTNQLAIKNLNALAKGLYFIKINLGDQSILRRIIKK